MIDLEKEAAKLIAFLKEQPRLSENAEQEGQGLIDRQAEERIHNGETVKEAGSEKIPDRASAVSSIVPFIPRCPVYNHNFKFKTILSVIHYTLCLNLSRGKHQFF